MHCRDSSRSITAKRRTSFDATSSDSVGFGSISTQASSSRESTDTSPQFLDAADTYRSCENSNFNIRAFGERAAANSPIQGSAADLIKIAMIRIDDALAESGLSAKMLLQVHDELVFEVPPEEIAAIKFL